ncbi:MAG: ferritin family protein [Candidatus Muiribacteriota bacterium]
MPGKYNALEIIEMAKKIEKNGAAFYKKAADKTSNSKTKQLLSDLATMEGVHEVVFGDMLNQISDGWSKVNEDSNADMHKYLEAMVDNIIFDLKNDNIDEILGDINKVFAFAIEKEKQSVLYYLGIKEMVPDKLGKDKISEIIGEEMKHIAILSDVARKHQTNK